MRAFTEEIRYNFGSHAVLVDTGIDHTGAYAHKSGDPIRPMTAPTFRYTVRVWLNCADGNTSSNPNFKEIKPTQRFKTVKDAVAYGQKLCRGATNGVEND